MALTKSQRIAILLVVDSAFFLLELIVGYSVHSLALVADSFHMLNDVISLLVGLWAVKVANTRGSSKMYTYGWQRAETLGALVNGVFLVALCLTIFLEAVQRFFEPQSVSSPKLVLIVGCCGLLSNLLGLLLFHDHGHSHGHEDSHSHHKVDATQSAEEGRNMDGTSVSVPPVIATATDLEGNGENTVDAASHPSRSETEPIKTKKRWNSSGANSLEPKHSGSGLSKSSSVSRRARRTSGSRTRYGTADDIRVHPASFRNEIIAASRLESIEAAPSTDSEPDSGDETNAPPTEASPLLANGARASHAENGDTQHSNHKHRTPKTGGSHSLGHSHGDLNMRGLFLHVMGDALGNVGVIASALIIWLSSYWWRFYADPLISLVITVIILCSALPLCRAASRILLQAVPQGLSVDDIKEDIEDLPGVVSCHHLHVWQLSDTKLVASLHIQLEFDYKGADSEQYMKLARAVRTCLHEYGIHSSTIQPEFCLEDVVDEVPVRMAADGNSAAVLSVADGRSSKVGSKVGSRAASIKSVPDACLLDCDDECGNNTSCCGPPARPNGGSH